MILTVGNWNQKKSPVPSEIMDVTSMAVGLIIFADKQLIELPSII